MRFFSCEKNSLQTLKYAPKNIGGYFYCPNNPLPKLIYDALDIYPFFIKDILNWQDEYSIWKRDGTLDEFRFEEMMIDIKNDHHVGIVPNVPKKARR